MLSRRWKINVKLVDGRSYNWIGTAGARDGQLIVRETTPGLMTVTICEHRYNFDQIQSYVAEPYAEEPK